MGRKLKHNYSVYNILSHKKKIIKQNKKIKSLTSLSEIVIMKESKIKENFMKFMRRLLKKNKKNYKNNKKNWKKNKIIQKKNNIGKQDKILNNQMSSKDYLISFLNIIKQCTHNSYKNKDMNNMNNINNQDDSINLISMLSVFNNNMVMGNNTSSNLNQRGITSIQNIISQHFINFNNNNQNYNNNHNNNDNNPNNNNSFQQYHNITSHSQPQPQPQLHSSSSSYPTHSTLSLCQPYLSQLILYQPQFPVYFICLYQKIFSIISLSTTLSEYQNRLIVKGIWNILIKYWKDKNYVIFTDVGENIEWAILNIIQWGFHVKRKELFQGEEMLRKQLEDKQGNQNKSNYYGKGKMYQKYQEYQQQYEQLQQQQQQQDNNDNDNDYNENGRRYFCTLEHIE